MTSKEKFFFNNEVDFLFDLIQLHSKAISKNHVTFAEELNKSGVSLFFKKEKTLAKAFFWVAYLLGSTHAYRNFISASR